MGKDTLLSVTNSNAKEEIITIVEEKHNDPIVVKDPVKPSNETQPKASITPELWTPMTIPDYIKVSFKDDNKDKTEPKKDGTKKPEDLFDNSPSELRHCSFGKYTSLGELKKLIDDYQPKTQNTFTKLTKIGGDILGGLLTLVPFYYLKRVKTVPQGYFQVVNRLGVNRTILTEGKHYLPNYYDSYEAQMDVDDDKNQIREIGENIRLVQVPPNSIGMVRVLLNKSVNHDTQQSESLGQPGEALILWGGETYAFREDQCTGFDVIDLNTDEQLIIGSKQFNENKTNPEAKPLDPLAIMTVKRNYLGCAYDIENGDYEFFESGKRRIFDTKEWRSFELKEITKKFTMGKDQFGKDQWLFLTVEKNKYVCIQKKNGEYLVLSEPGRYKFHSEEWLFDSIEEQDKDINVEFKKCWIFSPPYNNYAEVEDKSGSFHTLEAGKKYFLEKDKFKRIIVQDKALLTENSYLELGSKRIISPSKNVLIGARNVKTNNFVIFENIESAKSLSGVEVENLDSVKELPKEIYPKIEKIDKLSQEPQKFGPCQTVIIPPGKKGIIAVNTDSKVKGAIKIIDPGFHILGGADIIRESLPDLPIVLPIALNGFLSQDLFSLKGTFNVQFTVEDHASLSNILTVRKSSFADFTASLTTYISEKLSQLLKNYYHYQLTVVKGHDDEKVLDNYKKLTDDLTVALQEYSDKLKLGITFGHAQLASEIAFTDDKVKQNYADMAKTIVEIQAETARANEKNQRNKVDYDAEVEITTRQKDLNTKQIATATNKLVLEQQQENQIKIIKLENEQSLQKIALEGDLNRQVLANTTKQEITKNEIMFEQQKFDFEQKKTVTQAETNKTQQILQSQAEAEKKRVIQLTEAKTNKESSELNSQAQEFQAKGKMKLTDAEAYEIQQTAEARAKGLELENKAKELMPEKIYNIEMNKVEADKIAGVFKNGVIYDQGAKYSWAFFKDVFGKSQLGGIGGPKMTEVLKDYKDILDVEAKGDNKTNQTPSNQTEQPHLTSVKMSK